MSEFIDDQLGEFARDLRNSPTPFEAIVWSRLSRSQLGGHKFRRQHVIGRFIVDFFCPAKAVVVEIDGDTHFPDVDARRDAILARKGYTVLRFTNCEVRENLDGVAEQILMIVDGLPDRWPTERPHPNPSPEGEGLRT